VAANRGPVSFRRDDDGTLSVSRGGGGLVSGLFSVASQQDLLWVCAALSDADAQSMQALSTLLKTLKWPHTDRVRDEAKAEHATVYVARDGRGRVIGAR